MHLFLKNNIKIKGFLFWLILDPIKTYQMGVWMIFYPQGCESLYFAST